MFEVIITRISMGAGNQMFQYAAGKALSLEKKVPLKVDISSYEGYRLRKYELENFFNITTQKAIKKETELYYYAHPVKRVWNRLFSNHNLRTLALPYEENILPRTLLAVHDFFIPAHARKIYQEPHYHFDHNFFKAKNDTYLQGYWMSWRYFEKYKKEIIADFSFKPCLADRFKNMTECLQKQNSVSIHVRRTDYTYVRNGWLKGAATLKFYNKALQYIEQKTGKIAVYIFSDDISWAKENLADVHTDLYFMSSNISNSPLEDFYLMTQCRHNIIANSTFSWWAAYLNKNENKIVVAPEKWYNKAHYNYKDVYPPEWIKMSN